MAISEILQMNVRWLFPVVLSTMASSLVCADKVYGLLDPSNGNQNIEKEPGLDALGLGISVRPTLCPILNELG